MHQLAIVYEHPRWFQPLFAALEKAGIDYVAVHADGHGFDPIGGQPPAPVVFNRVAMSAGPRVPGQHAPVCYTMALLDHWQGQGALVLNGVDAMALDASKTRQLALINRLGLAAPASRVAHDAAGLMMAARAIGFPVAVVADTGGAGSGLAWFGDAAALQDAIFDGRLPYSANGVWLCQALVRPRGGVTTRIEVLGGRYLYAVNTVADEIFSLVHDDDRGLIRAPRRRVRAEPPPNLIAAAEVLAREAGMESCTIDCLIDDQCGTVRFLDINCLSSFVDDPMDVLGWDPHDRLIERLWHHISRMGG
ncbi:ATP-grasp domain-containing protein [Sandarakinorhabdus sp.]|uniref:ATP-grasp domain-containing protein n=1 Tax=Sandarakinorhabdus sp. TaxID=1916663 RepID=UPI003F6F802C